MFLLLPRNPWLALLLALLSCHDAPRDNPFDPALTPAVQLQVALDDTAGTTTLTWTPYEGQQPFREYRVLRHIAERTRVDTLVHIPQVQQTSYVDSSLEPNTAYVYRVAVVNTAGYETPSEERSVSGFSVGAVRLLEVEPDPQAGTLTLRWNRYVGPDFAGYRLVRRQVGTDREETLAEIAAPTDTTFIDQTARAGVEYVYTLVVAAAGQTLLSNTQEARLDLPPVEMVQAEFSSAEASASLTWTKYRGPRFKSYQVLRHTAEPVAEVIEEIADIADTSLVDTGLLGNTQYFYRVKVVTERGEEVVSEEKYGIFHELLATWSIEAERQPFLRLYREGEGIAALEYKQEEGIVRHLLLLFDAEGRLQKEQVLSDWIGTNSQRNSALALSAGGRRFLSVVRSGDLKEVGILAWGRDGQQIVQDLPLFADAFPQPLSGPEGVVRGEIALVGYGVFDNVAVSAGGNLLFSEDFEDFPLAGQAAGAPPLQGTVQGWELSDSYSSFRTLIAGPRDSGGIARRADPSWKDFRLEADIASFSDSKIGIQVGGDTFSRFVLWLDWNNQQAILDWSFEPPADLGLESRVPQFTIPVEIFGGPYYHLGLEVVGGQLSASVSSPFWGGHRASDFPWVSSAAIGDILALTVYDQPYTITSEGQATSLAIFPYGVSELRAWQDRLGRQQVGICMPEAGQLLLGIVPEGEESQWPAYLTRALGHRIGAQQGLLSYPLSFDVGPDGRIYVLDAGSGRILVFDSGRNYLTQWGRRGDGEGEFNAGSIAVDSQGFIYVADERNKRIQKFAP